MYLYVLYSRLRDFQGSLGDPGIYFLEWIFGIIEQVLSICRGIEILEGLSWNHKAVPGITEEFNSRCEGLVILKKKKVKGSF